MIIVTVRISRRLTEPLTRTDSKTVDEVLRGGGGNDDDGRLFLDRRAQEIEQNRGQK